LARSAASPPKIESVCKRAEAELEFGEPRAARNTILDAKRILANDRNAFTENTMGASRLHIALVESKLAWATADFLTASSALRSAEQILEELRDTAGHRVQALSIEVYLEIAQRAKLDGDFISAERYLARAQGALRKNRSLQPAHSFDVQLLQGQVDFISARGERRFAAREHCSLLNHLLELARSCRSIRRMLQIEVELTDPYLGLGRTSDALSAARRVASMARALKNFRLISFVSIYMADYLGDSDSWQAIPTILQDAQRTEIEGSREWAHMMLVEADYQERSGHLRAALVAAEKAWRAGVKMDSPRLTAAALRDMASVEFKLGNVGKASEYITGALPIAERCGSAEACVKAYNVAGAITGDRHYARMAVELRNAITRP
jgi:tetratricopeptide (TPR) repeat protein